MKTKLLRLFAYSSWFWAVFVVSLYLTFPVHRVRGVIVDRLEEAMGRGKQGAYGVDPKVQIGKVSMWRLSGLEMQNVSLQLASRDPDPGPTIDIDRLKARVGLLSLLTDAKSFSFQADLYEGSIDGAASVDEKGNVLEADVVVEKVDLGKAPFLLGKFGVPSTGLLSMTADLDLGPEPEKNAKGEVKLDVQGITLGPGELKIPLPGLTGGLTLPLIDMGNLKGELVVKDGKGKLDKLKLDGAHMQGELTADVDLRGRIGMSKIDGQGHIKIADAFLDENAKFKTLLEFPGPLQRAKDGEGRYHFTARGTLSNPNFALSRDGGKKAKKTGKAPIEEPEVPATPG